MLKTLYFSKEPEYKEQSRLGRIIPEIVGDSQIKKYEPLGAPLRPLYRVGNEWRNSGEIGVERPT